MRDVMKDALPDQGSRHVFKASEAGTVHDAQALRGLTHVWIATAENLKFETLIESWLVGAQGYHTMQEVRPLP